MQRFSSLRIQLGGIFIGFLILVAGSVAATFIAARAQADDAVLINLAGRQRMLLEKITWLALTDPENPELKASIQLFDQTLNALREGGTTSYGVSAADPNLSIRAVSLPPAPDPVLKDQLDQARRTWENFRTHLDPVDAALLNVESPALLAQIDLVVSQYQAQAEGKLTRLQRIQTAFFIAALALLALGYLLVQKSILRPLATLNRAARQIAEGDLARPVPGVVKNELGELGKSFEGMRAEVAAAQGELEGLVAQRTRELSSAFELSQEIVAHLELDCLLDSVTERARSLSQARAASLCLLDEAEDSLVLVSTQGREAGLINLRQPVRREPAVRVIRAGETVISETCCANCSFLQAHSPGQCAIAPLRAGGTTLGSLCVVRDEDETFGAEETRALTLLANSATIAITNARLVETGRRQAEESAALAERERLAAELHDNLAQTLSFLQLKIEHIGWMLPAGRTAEAEAELARVKTAVGEAYGQVRAALVGLQEPEPPAGDFTQKLNSCLADFRQATGLPVELIADDPSTLNLPRLAQAQALHILKEALINIQRHANARRVTVYAQRVNELVRLSIEDDGCGFDQRVEPGRHHHGLSIMQTRAERSGGSLTIESTIGAGTRIIACFPLSVDNRRPTIDEKGRKTEDNGTSTFHPSSIVHRLSSKE